jgi:hypothetical protein
MLPQETTNCDLLILLQQNQSMAFFFKSSTQIQGVYNETLRFYLILGKDLRYGLIIGNYRSHNTSSLI